MKLKLEDHKNTKRPFENPVRIKDSIEAYTTTVSICEAQIVRGELRSNSSFVSPPPLIIIIIPPAF
jgi:hypothetical protein